MLRTTQVLLLVGVVATPGFMAYAGPPRSASSWLFSLSFAAWTLVPYALGVAETIRHPSNRGSLSLLCAAAALLSGLGVVFLPRLRCAARCPKRSRARFSTVVAVTGLAAILGYVSRSCTPRLERPTFKKDW